MPIIPSESLTGVENSVYMKRTGNDMHLKRADIVLVSIRNLLFSAPSSLTAAAQFQIVSCITLLVTIPPKAAFKPNIWTEDAAATTSTIGFIRNTSLHE